MRSTFLTIIPAAMFAFVACAGEAEDPLELLAPAGAFLLNGECMMITRSGEGDSRRYRALATAIPRGGCASEFLGPGEIMTDLPAAKAAADAQYEKVIEVYAGHSSCAASEVVLGIARGLTAADAFNLDASRFLGTSAPLNLNFDLENAAKGRASRCIPAVSFIPGSPLYCLSQDDAANYANFTRFRVVENAREDVRVSMEHHRALHARSRESTGLSAAAGENLALMGINELPLLTEPAYAAATLAHLLSDTSCRDEISNGDARLRALFTRMLGREIAGVTETEASLVSAALVPRPEDPLPACEYGPGALLGESVGFCPDTYEEF